MIFVQLIWTVEASLKDHYKTSAVDSGERKALRAVLSAQCSHYLAAYTTQLLQAMERERFELFFLPNDNF